MQTQVGFRSLECCSLKKEKRYEFESAGLALSVPEIESYSPTPPLPPESAHIQRLMQCYAYQAESGVL